MRILIDSDSAKYRELLTISSTEPSVVTWATLVRDLLDLNKIGMGNYWITQQVQNENHFLSIFKQRLQDIFLQEWLAQVSETSSARLYKHIIRDKFQFESYLNLCNKSLRIAITKVRLSSHLFL